MRTFLFADDRSHKFWNITLDATSFTVQFGKAGTAGQTQVKTFPDEAKARKEYDKLIAEKLKKGYRETTPTQAGSLGEALEQTLLESPDDLATIMAYADYLSEQNDPRQVAQGEFIQVQLALEDATKSPAERKKLQTREKELLDAHQTEWVGDWPALTSKTGPEGRAQVDFTTPIFGFEKGILTTATFDYLGVECARAFVKAKQTRFIRKLYVGGFAYEEEGFEPGPDIPPDADEEDGPSEHVLLRWPYLANVRVFQLGWTSDEVYGERCSFQCHLSGERAHHFVKQMPRIEELYLFAHNVYGQAIFSLQLPHLRVAQIYHSSDYALDRLAKNASLGKLTHLLCHPKAIEDPHAYIRLEGLSAIVRSPHLTSLRHLQLRLADFGDEGCEAIVRSGILKRLTTLDLRHGRITDAGARMLAECPDIKHLQLLDLSRNALTADGIATLKSVGIQVNTDYPHEDVEDREYLSEGDYE